jgi:hypothetical protein
VYSDDFKVEFNVKFNENRDKFCNESRVKL